MPQISQNDGSSLLIRKARRDDVAAIVALYADDQLGEHGDDASPEALPAYLAAFDRIDASAHEQLYVAERKGQVIGTYQLSYCQTLTHRARLRAVIEAVQVASSTRSGGIGAAIIAHAISEARAAGAGVMELASNKRRVDAHRFYERLGFRRSHEGFKLELTDR